MNKKLLLLLSIITCINASITSKNGGYIYNRTESPIYYGNGDSTWLSSIAPTSYCSVKNYYIVYPKNNANGPALWLDITDIPETKYAKIEAYKYYAINGKKYLREETPTVYTNYRHVGIKSYTELILGIRGYEYLDANIYNSSYYPGALCINSNSRRGNIFNNTQSTIYFNTLGDGTIYTIAPNQNFNVGMGEKFLIYPTNNPNGKALYLEYNDYLGENMFKTCFVKDRNIDSSMPQGPEQIVYGHIQVDSDPVNVLTITGN